jgi:hypothetical protein
MLQVTPGILLIPHIVNEMYSFSRACLDYSLQDRQLQAPAAFELELATEVTFYLLHSLNNLLF